jgi:hypothetical protein
VISSSVPGQAEARRRRVDLAAVAGMIGAVLFVTVFTVHGWLYPGYSWTSMFVSELSLGQHGWVQILNFVLTGTLMLAFGRGLAAHFSTGAASRFGPVLVQGIGVSLIASGPFTTDPSAMFDQASMHGVVSGLLSTLRGATVADRVCTASPSDRRTRSPKAIQARVALPIMRQTAPRADFLPGAAAVVGLPRTVGGAMRRFPSSSPSHHCRARGPNRSWRRRESDAASCRQS